MKFVTSESENAVEWTDVSVRLVVDRRNYRSRLKSLFHRPHVNRKPRSWTECSQANIMKMRHRHKHGFSLRARLLQWDSIMYKQMRRLAVDSDSHRRWQRREYLMLEKMNKARYVLKPSLHHGSAWLYSVAFQVTKARLLGSHARRRRTPRKYWSELIFAVWARQGERTRWRHEWQYTVNAGVRRANEIKRINGWEECIWWSWRYLPAGKESNLVGLNSLPSW